MKKFMFSAAISLFLLFPLTAKNFDFYWDYGEFELAVAFGKAVSLETGVVVSNKDWRAPKYYIALDFNFAIFAYLWKNEVCN